MKRERYIVDISIFNFTLSPFTFNDLPLLRAFSRGWQRLTDYSGTFPATRAPSGRTALAGRLPLHSPEAEPSFLCSKAGDGEAENKKAGAVPAGTFVTQFRYKKNSAGKSAPFPDCRSATGLFCYVLRPDFCKYKSKGAGALPTVGLAVPYR